MTYENQTDPMELLKNMWGNMGFSLPGMVTPTVDTDELGKRIADLKAVEGWLKSNLSLLQMSIQALEMQRSTLLAFEQMSKAAQGETQNEAGGAGIPNPFLNPAAWPMPWTMMGSPVSPEPATEPEAAETAPSKTQKRKPKR
jgi:hypothetical protein